MKRLRLEDINCWIHSCKNKKVIVFGSDKVTENLIVKMRLFDIFPVYCVEIHVEGLKKCAGLEVKNYYELLKENWNNIYILLSEMRWMNRQARLLDELGLVYLKSYNFIFDTIERTKLGRKNSLDPNLGYGLPVSETGKYGVKIWGNCENAELKIAILGGSTSDPCMFPWKSWPQYLYENMTEAGRNAAVIVGGVCAYTSSQELIKLIRDVLFFKPNIVISYSGFNDACLGKNLKAPYVSGYQREVMKSILMGGIREMAEWRVAEDLAENNLVKECNYGNEYFQLASDVWLNNERMMNAICAEYGIKFIGVLQPMLCMKSGHTQEEKEIMYLGFPEWPENITTFCKEIQIFIKSERYSYIFDATSWLDSEENIYFDAIHVYEEGNLKVAEKMNDLIENVLVH